VLSLTYYNVRPSNLSLSHRPEYSLPAGKPAPQRHSQFCLMVVAECGTGKTLIALGAIDVHGDRREAQPTDCDRRVPQDTLGHN
jgi:hypothetical protein